MKKGEKMFNTQRSIFNIQEKKQQAVSCRLLGENKQWAMTNQQ
jgi:hypothetical protein